jgi:hypothetical protein
MVTQNLTVQGGITGNIFAVNNRSVSQSSLPPNSAMFGLGSFGNNGDASSYADFIHFNCWSDGSAGLPNLLALNKGAFGMRIFKPATYNQGSITAYTDYRDVIMTTKSTDGGVNITATGVGSNSLNALGTTIGSFNQIYAANGAANFIQALNTSSTYIEGPTIFRNYSVVSSGVSITNTSGLTVTYTVTANTFNANSDVRIKKDITDMNSQSSLDILRKIKPREYTMINGVGKESVYGFVAQEVKEIIPKSTHLVKDFIPSIYENAFVDKTKITLIYKTTTDISCCKLKLRDENGGDKIVNVTSIKDGKTFTIDTDISSNIFYVDISGNKLDKNTDNGTTTYMLGSQVYIGDVKQGIFVYGIEVDDFHTINKDTIFTVSLSATQELDSQLQEARQTIRTLEERIAAIERRFS